MNNSFFKKYAFSIILVILMVIASMIVFKTGTTPDGIKPVTTGMVITLLFVGFAAGLLGGWIGTGGCSVMLPVLHFWLGFPAALAVGTTLFAVIFTAISGGYGHFKRKNLDKRITLWMGGTGILGVLLGSWLFTLLSSHSKLLGFIIGIVFIWPSLRMISEGLNLRKNSTASENTISESKTKPEKLSIFGFLVGTFTGIVGLGGGYALVPGLIYLFGVPVYITMGTSLAIMIPMAIVGGGIKLAQGFVFLGAALILATGTIIGAQIGAATIKKFKPKTLKLIFGIYFLYVAVKFIGNFLGVHFW